MNYVFFSHFCLRRTHSLKGLKIYDSVRYYPFGFISFILFWFFLLDVDRIVRVEIYSLNLHQFYCHWFILVCRSNVFKDQRKYVCLVEVDLTKEHRLQRKSAEYVKKRQIRFFSSFNIELFQFLVPLISNNFCQCEIKWSFWMRRVAQSRASE